MFEYANMSKLKKYGELIPDTMKAFVAFDKAAFAEGLLSVKMKELMAIAVAVTTQCGYCIELHQRRAKTAGATEAEIAEAVMVSAAIRAGGSVTHGLHCLE